MLPLTHSTNSAMIETRLIFTYGTLKKDFPNYQLMQDLITKNDAVHLGPYTTHRPYPLVCGPHGIPYLINIPESGHPVKGEVYSVTSRGLALVDELEGTSRGHYERLPIEVVKDEDGAVSVEAEAYFAGRSFGEALWERKGKVGLSEYSEMLSGEYVRVLDRPLGTDSLADIRSFLSSKH
ncbi:AIG2 domain-containing protein [Cephalotus follicularis]|uniref:Gamma-glutamylcyclotransferase family protein n=1 Tax=Cephalotus follicularis TaxID=3775 RepID=A0A1Q3AQK9_CEPFO|nr:AIG2 domain-containing protein [Cephalotus follicularis]